MKMNLTKLLNKYHNGEKLTKKEETYLRRKLVDKADRVFSIFIRNRDKNKGCITCGKQIQHCCHWIPRGRYSHRWREDNCNGGCVYCNTYNQEEHKVKFTIIQTKRHGLEWVEEQNRIKHKKKPKIPELIEIIEKYERKNKTKI